MEPEHLQLQTLDAALKYLSIGWSVIPIRHPKNPPKGREDDTKVPHVKWKPYQTRLAKESELREWWKKWPDAQVGVITGKLSGFVSLDFDTPVAMERFRYTVAALPETIGQKTGRVGGGSQYFFKYPSKETIKSKNNIAKNIDLKADGGYVVVPPSLHKSGSMYEWLDIDPVDDGIDDLMLLDDCPEILNFCLSIGENETSDGSASPNGTPVSQNKPGWVNELLWGVNEGSRDVSCTKLAGYFLRQNNGDIQETVLALSGWNARNKPPLTDEVILKCVKSIASRHGTDKLADYLGTDVFNVERLVYPDSVVKYNIYVNGQDSFIQIDIDEFSNPRKFRNKFADLTKRLIAPIKENDWIPLINGALSESVDVHMSEDETIIGSVSRIIAWEIKSAVDNPVAPEEYLQHGFIVINSRIYFHMDVLVTRLKETTGIKPKSKKELGRVLRIIGYEPISKRMSGKVIKCWGGSAS